MEVGECVLSAGRAVLELVEREWQPLSAGELELRLDQAVEEVLETELVARLEATQPSPPPPPPPPPAATTTTTTTTTTATTTTTVYLQLLQKDTNTETPSTEEREDGAVQYISELLQSSNSTSRLAGRARLSLSHTVLVSLTLLSERVSYRSVSRRFQLEKGNIHRIFFSFCERINTLQEKIIRWPIGREAEEALFSFSSLREELQGVPKVLGVLGEARIPIRLPIGKHDVESTVPEVKRMKKEAHPDSWLNLELVCDRRGRFLHCRISRGSESERGGALRDRLTLHPDLMPSGSCLVAPDGFPLTAQVLTPYTGSLGPREELFNKTLEGHFEIFRQAVANLRARFQRLRYLDIGNYDRARTVVLTACVLHNVFLDLGQVVEGEVEKEETETQEKDGEVEDESVRRRDAITDLLFRKVDS